MAQTPTLYDDSSSYYTTEIDAGAAAGFAAAFFVWTVIWLAVAVVAIIAMWKIFVKAGQEGWKAIIPIYNIYVLLKIVGRPDWWLLLYFIPVANFVVAILVCIDLARSFGKSDVFGVVGLFIFSLIGLCMLGFGKDKYIGPSVTPPAVGGATA